MPTKIGFHTFSINLYLHEFFELTPWTIIASGLEGKLGQI